MLRLGIEPSWLAFQTSAITGLAQSAKLVETEGVEPSTAGCRPAVFPLALRPHIGVTGGTRTRIDGATIHRLIPSATATLGAPGVTRKPNHPLTRRKLCHLSYRCNHPRATNFNSPSESAYKYGPHSLTSRPIERSRWRLVCTLAGSGLLLRGILASSGVRSSFLLLHGEQHATRLSHKLAPPFDLGTM